MPSTGSGIPAYSAAKWVPRELLLCLLARLTPAQLRAAGLRMRECGGMPAATPHPGTRLVVNRMNGRALALRGPAVELFDLCRAELDLDGVRAAAPALFDQLAFFVPAEPAPA